MADRIYVSSGYDKKILDELYPWVKKNMIYTMTLRAEDGPEGVVSMPTGNIGTEWFEHCEWKGIVAHVGGLHHLRERVCAPLRLALMKYERIFLKLHINT